MNKFDADNIEIRLVFSDTLYILNLYKMGIFNKLLGLGKSKRGKVITFSFIGFGTVIFVVGTLIAAIGSSVVNPREMTLIAPNMEYRSDFFVGGRNLTGYHLTVTEKKTSITVRTPLGTTAPATFHTNSDLVDITPKVPSNGTAILELKTAGDTGLIKFHDPNDPLKDLDSIRIDVVCGSRKAVIYVRIVLAPAHINVVATLERQNVHGEWDPAHYLDMADFNPFREPETGYRNYRVNLTLRIFGEIVDTLIPGHNFFFAREVFSDEWSWSDIKLLGSSSELHKDRCRCISPDKCFCCTVPCNCIDTPFIITDADYLSYFFMIAGTFDGKEYFTIPDFELIIKAWNN